MHNPCSATDLLLGKFPIDEDICRAYTLPSCVYTDPAIFEACKRKVFSRSWHFAASVSDVKVPGQVYPVTLLEGLLDEPLLFTRDSSDTLHCLSNVCTHRGHLVAECPGHERFLRCRYHGRRFALDGTFQQMPEFEGVANFPTEADSLPSLPIGQWKELLFASPAPAFPFEEQIRPIKERLDWLPLDEFGFERSRSRDYLVKANWALYVENYLDALHVPFVHGELSGALDFENYPTINFPYGNLQIGAAKDRRDTFGLPFDSPDAGQNVAAYYAWLFPATMLNFYPWGLSINVVQPLAVDLTRVSFLRYVRDRSDYGSHVSADSAVDRVEREDEAVVEAVQKGVRSAFYDRGRYSPSREKGTHHFHRLLEHFLTTG